MMGRRRLPVVHRTRTLYKGTRWRLRAAQVTGYSLDDRRPAGGTSIYRRGLILGPGKPHLSVIVFLSFEGNMRGIFLEMKENYLSDLAWPRGTVGARIWTRQLDCLSRVRVTTRTLRWMRSTRRDWTLAGCL